MNVKYNSIAILLLGIMNKVYAHSNVPIGSKPLSFSIFLTLLLIICLATIAFYFVLMKKMKLQDVISPRVYVVLSSVVILINSGVIFSLYVEV